MPNFLLVFIGGGLGSLCRWGLSLLIQPLVPRFPWATLASNALACLVMGVLLQQQLGTGVTEQRRLLLAVGFCGGFSTFSTFTAETLQLWLGGQSLYAAINILANLMICMVFLVIGMKLG
ncbi:MAG: fluoride efflux transporter CrcB [Saprospiraceae bacterium]|nr:fluoride efflux transporter CrcB [Saprospiraceae bacterium]